MQALWRLYDWLHALTIVFAIASLILELRYIYKFSIMFQEIKRRYTRERKAKQEEYADNMERIQEKNLKERAKIKKRKTLFGTQLSMSPRSSKERKPLELSLSIAEGQSVKEGTLQSKDTFQMKDTVFYQEEA